MVPKGETNLGGLSVLIVEDDALLRRQIRSMLEQHGVDVAECGTLREAGRLLEHYMPDFVLLDLSLPDGYGLNLLTEQATSQTAFIVITGEGSVRTAVEAMRLGALDYLTKPFEPEQILLALRRVLRDRREQRQRQHVRDVALAEEEAFIFGRSMSRIREQLQRIIELDQLSQTVPPPIVLVGETGTGKTSLARWIHVHGPRANGPFIEVNCAALPQQLIESELFGYERGAFTDARTRRIGLFEATDGGTLFLDELPSLPLSAQAKLLTVIEEGLIRRIGATKPIRVNVRLIVASQQPLRSLVDQGLLREDLFHRLNLFELRLPPLRERGEEVIELAERFVQQVCRKYRLAPKFISEEGKKRLLAYKWPGNVRELLHEVERAVVFSEDQELGFEHLLISLPLDLGNQKGPSSLRRLCGGEFMIPQEGISLEEVIRELIEQALRQTDGNVSAAARLLGVSRDYIRYHIGKKN